MNRVLNSEDIGAFVKIIKQHNHLLDDRRVSTQRVSHSISPKAYSIIESMHSQSGLSKSEVTSALVVIGIMHIRKTGPLGVSLIIDDALKEIKA